MYDKKRRPSFGFRSARWLAACVAAVVGCGGCDEVDPVGSTDQGADGRVSSDGGLDGTSLPQDATATTVVPKGCVHDSHCIAFGMVCDTNSGLCVACLTDQNCPQPQFCLEQTCVDDVCKPGTTRCYGTFEVSMCAANGGAWLPSLCPQGQLCAEGKCRPLPCKPGALRCDGANVVRCRDDGTGEEVDEDCAQTDRICLGGHCEAKACKAGAIICADTHTSLVCEDADKGYKPSACDDGNACTFDLCEPGVGCTHPGKPDGMACGAETWCMVGQCTNITNNLIVIFDTSGSMKTKVPGKICYDQSWPVCIAPNQACDRMGVSKNIFAKAFATIDPKRTKLAMFRFPQVWLSPEAKTSPKPPFWKPPVACANGNYLGYSTMTGHTAEETVGPETSWYWDNLDEVLCVPYPVTPDHDPSAEITAWMDGEETYGSDPELRAIGGTPIGRTLFYAGEYLRNRVVIDGLPCSQTVDCKNSNYICDAGACRDPARACRQTTIVVFTDGGEENYADKLFSPWVQAKRLAYGLRCKADADCVGGARCVCPPTQPGCSAAQLECLPESLDTGFYCRETMAACLPTAKEGSPGYCKKKNGQNQCVPDPIVGVGAEADVFAHNVLRSPDGVPFSARIHVIDISNDGNGVERSGNLARSGGGLLLAPDGADENAFLASVVKSFDVAPKAACGVGVLPCAQPGFSASCDDNNACTNDACNQTTATCSHAANVAACDDGDACTLSDRCLDGECRPGIAWVETFAGNGLSQPGFGEALTVGLPDPRGVVEMADGGVLVSVGHVIARYADGKLLPYAGSGKSGKEDGSPFNARFLLPAGIDRDGDAVIVADTGNHRIRRIAPASAGRTVSTLAGSSAGFADGATAAFSEPVDVARDFDGAVLVADRGNHRLRRVVGDGVDVGTVSTLIGDGVVGANDGPVAAARLAYPSAVAVGAPGAIFVAERYTVRRLSSGFVVTVVGGKPGFADGVGSKAQFDEITGLIVRGDAGLVLADSGNHALRDVSPAFAVTTIAGDNVPGWVDGFAGSARFWGPRDISLGGGGRVWVADRDNHRLRRLQLAVVACADGGPCNAGACDPASGLCITKPKADGAPCDLGPCLSGESCLGLLCSGGVGKDCDDGEACTAESCAPETGVCAHVAITGACDDGTTCTTNDACSKGACVGKALNCDDGDDTTLDLCEAGQCLHRVGPCSKDIDCFDGESACSLDTCVNKECVYQATGKPGCCQSAVWRVDFDDGSVGDLQLVASLGPQQGWRPWTVAGAAPDVADGAKVLYYGDPALGNYDLATTGHHGTALRAKLPLPAGRVAKVRIRLWVDTERAALYDALTLVVRRGGEQTILWQKGPKTPTKTWVTIEADLSAHAGRVVELELGFDTIDAIDNGGRGVLVDWIEVDADCG